MSGLSPTFAPEGVSVGVCVCYQCTYKGQKDEKKERDEKRAISKSYSLKSDN